MSTTIFCFFEQQDLADLAMGHVRRINGVYSIRTVVDGELSGDGAAFIPASLVSVIPGNGSGPAIGFGWEANSVDHTVPSQPISVRIMCEDSVRSDVIRVLVNQHAHRIVTTP